MKGTRPHGFLLDENLSPKLKAGFGPEVWVVHARELGQQPTDLELWTYAEHNGLVVVTKDADFTDRVLAQAAPPPWVVQVRCGNLRARALREFLEGCWPRVLTLLPEHRLIVVYPDRLEALT